MIQQAMQRARLAAAGVPAPAGVSGYEILAITAGQGNHWVFPAEALRRSLPLWDGVESFVDHAARTGQQRSVRDLCGRCSAPRWDQAAEGVRLTFTPCGPSGPLVDALARELLAAGARQPDVGFSADVGFTVEGQGPVQCMRVREIVRVFSLDVVIDPARGGAFLSALEVGARQAVPVPKDSPGVPEIGARLALPVLRDSPGASENGQRVARHGVAAGGGQNACANRKEEITMEPNDSGFRAGLGAGSAATMAAGQAPDDRARLASDTEAARVARMELCSLLLDSSLAASRLPLPLQEHLRRRFSGRSFEASDLTAAVDEARKLASDLTAGLAVSGLRQVQAMYSTEDQLQAAVDDLLDAPREHGAAGARVHRLSGIRELYHTLTGDLDYHGGYYPERAGLSTTADFTGLVKNALNKIVANQWGRLGRAGYDWWTKVATVEHFNSLQSITGTLVGTVGSLPAVAEGAEYTELTIGDSPETATFTKYGGYIPLTLELIDRDETRKLRAYPRELASAGLRKISALVAAIFTESGGAGPTLADGGALFNAAAVASAGGHKNLLTTALSAGEWEVVSAAVYNQPLLLKNAGGYYGAGPKMAINPRYLLAPRALYLMAAKILYPSLENAASIYSENLQQGKPGDVVLVPEWTDATDWAAACDPEIAPAIYIGERFGIAPEVFIAGDEHSPAVFSNDEHRLKVRHFLAVWVNDYRPLHKSNVAA
jgi:hypothetical protein